MLAQTPWAGQADPVTDPVTVREIRFLPSSRRYRTSLASAAMSTRPSPPTGRSSISAVSGGATAAKGLCAVPCPRRAARHVLLKLPVPEERVPRRPSSARYPGRRGHGGKLASLSQWVAWRRWMDSARTQGPRGDRVDSGRTRPMRAAGVPGSLAGRASVRADDPIPGAPGGDDTEEDASAGEPADDVADPHVDG